MTETQMRMLRLWHNDHFDTLDIARLTDMKESEVYSLLPRLREERRLEKRSAT